MSEHKVEIFKQNPYGEDVKKVSDTTKDETDSDIKKLEFELSRVKDETDYSQPVTVPGKSPFDLTINITDEEAQKIADDINKMTEKPIIVDDKSELEKIAESQYTLLAHKIEENEQLVSRLNALTQELESVKAENMHLKNLLKSYEDVINHTAKIKETEPKQPVKEKLSVRIRNRFKRKKEEEENEDKQ